MRVLAPTFSNPPLATDADKAEAAEYRRRVDKATKTRRMNAEKMRTVKLDPRKLEEAPTEILEYLRDMFHGKKNWLAVEMIAAEITDRKRRAR